MAECVLVKLPGGGSALVRMSSRRPQRCWFCEKRSALLCDFPVARDGRAATCDKPLCEKCAVKNGKLDFCPNHERLKL